MIRKIVWKFGQLMLLLAAVTLIAFVLVDLSPIDPIVQYSMGRGLGLSEEQKANLIQQWDLNKPLLTRYVAWVNNVLQGEFGYSHIYQRPVLKMIQEGMMSSLLLMALSWITQGFFGFLLGLIAGMKEGRWLDRLIQSFAIITSSTPTYWIAILLILCFSVYLHWFPLGFGSPIGVESSQINWADRLYYAILPAITLALTGVGPMILHTREKVIDVLHQDYVLYQQSRGLQSWNLVTRSALRNVMLPAITLQFMNFSELFSGSILAEQAFNYQGLGKYSVDAGIQGDVPLLLGIVVFSTLFVFVGNQLADVCSQLIDYRTGRQSS